VGKCRERCWRYDWVIDLDVQKFFDTVPWERIIAAVEANTALPWAILYVKRWLAAPIRMPGGTLAERDRGTPQGPAVSPVLANLFMHYAFDLWMAREFPACPFERYADDAVVHCKSLAQARYVLDRLRRRMEQVGVSLHPEKTRIVYCIVNMNVEVDRKDGGPLAAVLYERWRFVGPPGSPYGGRFQTAPSCIG
jgi:retron-type reverse transcriptase